jgi:hypothetical protein
MYKTPLFIFMMMFSLKSFSQDYSFCYKTYTSKYVININSDSRNSASFNLYDLNGKLLKATIGTWELQDLGLYGSATYLVYKFGGANSDMPDMKLLFIRDGFGKPQELRDSQKRTWDRCK